MHLLEAEVPRSRFLLPLQILLKLRSATLKHSGFFKIVVVALLFGTALLSWNNWKSGLFKGYEIDSKTIANALYNLKSKDGALAAACYTKGNESDAVTFVNRQYNTEPDNVELGIVYAQMLTRQGHLGESKLVLSDIHSKADEQQKQEIAFVMAITCLKATNFDECKYWLAKIPKKSGHYRQAQKLLHQIKPFVTTSAT